MEFPLEETTFLNRVVPGRLVLVCAIATLTPQSFYQCILSPYVVHFSFFLVCFGAGRCGIVRLFLARAVISFLFRLFFPKFQLRLLSPAVVVFRTKDHLDRCVRFVLDACPRFQSWNSEIRD